MYPTLNFPLANLKLKGDKIWDILQKKHVINTPEEWVRQHMIHFLVNEKGYSKNLMQSEHTVTYNRLKKRCDIVIYDRNLKPIVIVECKAPSIKLTEDTFFQIAKYYSTLKAPLLILSNGIHHIHALINSKENRINYLKEVPNKSELDILTNNF